MEPGPIDASVLGLQYSHRSNLIWNGQDPGRLKCRSHLKAANDFQVCDGVGSWIRNSQFFGMHRLTYVIIDADLITALVERWREETHTFHLPFGEVTVTLQDVNVLLGLKIDGMPITGRCDYNWGVVIYDLLRLAPPSDAFVGASLKLSWLKENFQGEPEIDNEEVMNQYIRAYILFLIGTLLCPDKSGNTVPLMYIPLLEDLYLVDDYSWGSATLACLYRNLCKASTGNASQVAGCLILLQLWSWERIGMGRPEVVVVPDYVPPCPDYPLGSQMQVGLDPLGCRWMGIKRKYKDHKLAYGVYRQILDMLTEEQFIWEPYTIDVLECLPGRCREERDAYLVKVPLICFYMVELHNPDRCMRQFGWYQEIPEACNTQPSIHAIDNRTNMTDYASGILEEYVEEWNDRREHVLDAGIPYVGRMSYEDPYMQWYLRHTRRLICPTSSGISDNTRAAPEFQPSYTDVQSMAHGYAYIYNTASRELLNMPDSATLGQNSILQQFKALSLQQLQNANLGHLVRQDVEQQVTTPPPPRHYNFRSRASQPPMTPIEEGETPGESSAGTSKGKGKRSRRK